jgi:hypothetical protein
MKQNGGNMKRNALMIMALVACCVAHAGELSLKDCMSIDEDFRIKPFLAAARELQQMGQDKAVKRLRDWAKGGANDDQVIILSRMLFEKKEGGEFRRPMIGGAVFLGGSSYDQWPMEPIALHKGVPILITRGYILDGKPEPSSTYLEYCVKNCQWSTVKFVEQDTDVLKKIIADFIKTSGWKEELTADEQHFLMNQAEPPVGGDGNGHTPSEQVIEDASVDLPWPMGIGVR